MSTHLTSDLIEVDVVFYEEDAPLPEGLPEDTATPVYVVTFPDTSVKTCHPSAFEANYTEIGA